MKETSRPKMRGIRTVLGETSVEHLVLYSLMLLTASLVFRFGTRALPAAIAGGLGAIPSRSPVAPPNRTSPTSGPRTLR